MFNKLTFTIESLEKNLQHFVPRTAKGHYFSQKISPKQSRIQLLDESSNYYITSEDAREKKSHLDHNGSQIFDDPREKSYLNDLSLNFACLQDDINCEVGFKEPLPNLSIIEKNAIDENEEFFLFSQDRNTPELVDFEEICEEMHQRKNKTPNNVYMSISPTEIEKDIEDLKKITKSGKWFRKSSMLGARTRQNDKYAVKSPLKTRSFIRKMNKSRSSQNLNDSQLLEIDDYKKLGMVDVNGNKEKYALQDEKIDDS